MIALTRFDGTSLVVNSELIEFVEATPDTIISMTTGRKVIVRETPQSIIEAVVAYKRRIFYGPDLIEENTD